MGPRRLALLVFACASCAEAEPPAERGQRIVLVTLDTLRKDAFTPEHMPRTHALAEEGLVFERFYASAPTTQPTHATLFTGKHPWEHGVVRNGMALPDALPTLAEELSAAGWHTEGVVSSFPVHRRFGYGRGFARFDDAFTFERKNMPETWAGGATEGEHFFSIADSTTEKALAALDRMESRRQFLWVHYFDAHNPYGDLVERPVTLHFLRTLAAREETTELPAAVARARSLYGEDVGRMDREFARLLERLAAEADEFETHVLVTVDHGESFGEDGAYGHDARLTPEQIHVPTFLLSPRVSPGVSHEIAGTIDVHATLLSLAGLPERVQGGRDLTLAAGESPAAVGMRRYDPGAEPPRFYHVSGQRLLAGDERRLRLDDLAGGVTPGDAHADVRALFRHFAAELGGADASVLEDEETLRALEALGYGGE